MRHRILTCKNHPNLRWSTKDCAWSDGYGYNGTRNIFFNGEPSGLGMFSDGSGLDCTCVPDDPNGPHISPLKDEKGRRYRVVKECTCPSSDLILAPEDALVTT